MKIRFQNSFLLSFFVKFIEFNIKQTIEAQKKGNVITISPDLAYDMGRIAHILAHHVVEITDIGLLLSF